MPHHFGVAAEDVNCRCRGNIRARWAVTPTAEKKRMKWDGEHGALVKIDSDEYREFKRLYLKEVEKQDKSGWKPLPPVDDAEKTAEVVVSEPTKGGYREEKISGKALTSGGSGGIIRNKEITNAVADGSISLNLNPEKQNPHIYGTKEYNPVDNKSYFTITIEELQKIIDEKHGTGEVRVKANGQIKETLTLKQDIGTCVEPDGTVFGKTNRITIHYSKKRTHAVPSKKEVNENES